MEFAFRGRLPISERQLGGSVKYGADGTPFDFAMPNGVPVGAVFNTTADAAATESGRLPFKLVAYLSKI